MTGSSQVIRIEELGAGFWRLHLACGHSLKRKVRRPAAQAVVGNHVTCNACLNRSPLAEVGISSKQALGGEKRGPSAGPAPCHCHLGPGRWGK